MQVGCLTTPAQYFHILRRQMLRSFRKPLILMMPKSLLRNKDSASDVSELSKGGFQCVLDDSDIKSPEAVRRIVFCTGKVFFDLNAGRTEKGQDKVALVRVEQLNPFPSEEAAEVIGRYPNADQVVWCQEEPQNMGAWDFAEPKIRKLLPEGRTVGYVGRRSTASTATGVQKMHLAEQKAVVEQALDL